MSETRDYPRLRCVAFGKAMLASKDLDPVYVAVHRAKLPSDQLARLLVAYWCLYHLGCAARLSECSEREFWARMALAAANAEDRTSHEVLPASCAGRWPRGTERRHWRGAQSVRSFKSVLDKARCGKAGLPLAEHLVDYLGTGKTFDAVSARVRELTGFGPWIAFKVADMLERVAGYPIDFAGCQAAFYGEPAKGALLYYNEHKRKPYAGPLEPMGVALQTHRLIREVGAVFAPPDMKRKINVQEAETIFCKWKSHLGGHYALGKDTREVFHGLVGWGRTATKMQDALRALPYCPKEGA